MLLASSASRALMAALLLVVLIACSPGVLRRPRRLLGRRPASNNRPRHCSRADPGRGGSREDDSAGEGGTGNRGGLERNGVSRVHGPRATPWWRGGARAEHLLAVPGPWGEPLSRPRR